MLKSMTGFGKSYAENESISVDIELKSVNSRFLDTYFRLPNFLSLKEFELKDVIKNKVKRGKINITLQVNFKDPKDSPWGINTEKLNDFLLTVKDIKKQSNINEELRLNHLLSNKDLFSGNKIEISEEDFEFIKEALNKAIEELDIMKTNEGSELAKDLIERTKEIETKVDEINANARDSVKENHSLLKERIKKLIDDANINEERLETELAILADKADITEECVRLKSHLKFFNDSLNTEESNGKRLNFLCQEINREANTIASKTLSSEISHKSIFIKEEIEKIREQIQNIEWIIKLKKGKLIVISAPSGTGKTTIIRQILKSLPEIIFSVSATTRIRREDEVEGKHYYFISEEEFKKKIENNEFVEWGKFYDYYYGTYKSIVEDLINQGKSIILEIDVNGALNLKKIYHDAVLIYIVPPSIEELARRLKNRNTEGKSDLQKRVERATMELSFKDEFDYLVENINLEKALKKTKFLIKNIIKKEI